MRLLAAAMASLSLLGASLAHADQTKGTSMSDTMTSSLTPEDIRAVSPALDQYTTGALQDDLWQRPGLSPRDRSLVTVSALIALNRPDQLRSHMALASQNGVTQEELVEALTHLAFYAGWPSAVTAAGVAKEVFRKP